VSDHAPTPPQSEQQPETDAVDTTDPAAVWKALLDRMSAQRSFAWLRFLKITSLEQDRVTLAAQSGHREVLGFCTDERLSQIAEMLRPILGRKVRVSLQRANAQDADPSAAQQGGDQPDTDSQKTDRRQAMGLPLVQRVLEVFPDATLVDARDESEIPNKGDQASSQ